MHTNGVFLYTLCKSKNNKSDWLFCSLLVFFGFLFVSHRTTVGKSTTCWQHTLSWKKRGMKRVFQGKEVIYCIQSVSWEKYGSSYSVCKNWVFMCLQYKICWSIDITHVASVNCASCAAVRLQFQTVVICHGDQTDRRGHTKQHQLTAQWTHIDFSHSPQRLTSSVCVCVWMCGWVWAYMYACVCESQLEQAERKRARK